MKRIFLICSLLSVFVLIVYGTPIQWDLITMPNQRQMPVGNVHQIIQDREGYIWYATDGGGLCRDNGHQIDVIREGMPSLQISRISEDTVGNIWVGTYNGLCWMERDENQKVKSVSLEPFASHFIDALISTTDGMTWAAVGDVMGCFDTQGRCCKVWRFKPSKNPNKYVNSFFEDSKGHLWILEYRGGLLCYDRTSGRFRRMPWDVGEAVEMVEDTLHHCFWVATWNRGLIRYDASTEDGRKPSFYTKEVTPWFNYLDVCISADCQTLFTTDMSMLRQWRILTDGTLEEDKTIRQRLPQGTHILDKMNLDKDGNIWVSSYMPHTFILSPSQQLKAAVGLTHLNDLMLKKTGMRVLPHNIIAEEEDLWLWQGRVGLVNYNPRSGIKLCDGIRAPYHLSRMEKCNRLKGIWIALGDAVYRVWREGMLLRQEFIARIPTGDFIYSIYDAGDGLLWLGSEHGVFRYDFITGEMTCVEETASAVLFLVTDASGRPQGLTDDRKTLYTALGRGNEGTLWWGDSQGCIYSQGSHDTIPRFVYCAMAGETVNRICIDKKGHVWALSDQSISEYNPKTRAHRILSATDERLGVDFFRSISVVGDTIYIGGAGNVLRLNSSSDLDRPSSASLPVVSTILCDGVSYLPQEKDLDIPNGVKVTEVRMSTFDMLYARQIRYAYRIRELGDEWVTLPFGENTLRILLPSAGRYTLEARATDRYGVWSSPVVLLVMNKLPAWWQTWMAYCVYIIICILLLWLVVRSYISRQKEKHEEQMQRKLTELKFRFFTNISHELRTPLTLIITPLESMVRKGGNEVLLPILHQAEHLLDLVNRLLEFRKIDSGKMRFQPHPGNLSEFIRMEVETFIPLAESKQVSIKVETPERDLYGMFDHEKMHHILSNLLSNAIKYNRVGGSVLVVLDFKNSSSFALSVRDTGIGIPDEDKMHIFDRFYQAGNRTVETGTGIGLNMTREFVRLHGGELTMESVEGEGSTFAMTLPILQVTSDEDVASESSTGFADGAQVLLVEDNAVFCDFLSNELIEEGFRVITATDGMEAWERLQENPAIDVIVSDIMMPRMDGVEFCCKLKSDIKTSHIPVILLTARSGNESVLEGYNAGADFYLTKPFSIAILQNRIKHLLAQSEKRRHVFLQSVELKAEELSGNSLDRQFITRAVELVEANMDNTEYSVEAFAGDLHTDRSNLYRKLHTLTGQKPSEFIRTIRLKHAARLLLSSNYSIAEIADSCGFSTPSYFTHSFKVLFGQTPGEYQKKNK